MLDRRWRKKSEPVSANWKKKKQLEKGKETREKEKLRKQEQKEQGTLLVVYFLPSS